jgi:hypothetical protein
MIDNPWPKVTLPQRFDPQTGLPVVQTVAKDVASTLIVPSVPVDDAMKLSEAENQGTLHAMRLQQFNTIRPRR